MSRITPKVIYNNEGGSLTVSISAKLKDTLIIDLNNTRYSLPISSFVRQYHGIVNNGNPTRLEVNASIGIGDTELDSIFTRLLGLNY